MRKKHTITLGFSVLLVVLLLVTVGFIVQSKPVQARPLLMPRCGEEEVGDYWCVEVCFETTGWQLAANGYQTFTSDRRGGLPIWWVVEVADNDLGYDAIPASSYFFYGSNNYGYRIDDMDSNGANMSIDILWGASGIGFTRDQAKWYQRGTDYASITGYCAVPPYRP